MFERIDIYTYQRSGQGRARKKAPRQSTVKKGSLKGQLLKKNLLFSWVGQAITAQRIMFYVIAFFLGRAILLGELTPFGVAFAAAITWVFGAIPLIPVTVILGLLTVTDGIGAWSSAVVVMATFLAILNIKPQINRPWLVIPGTVGVLNLVVKVAFISWQGADLYPVITIVFESVFAAVLTFIFMQSLKPFADGLKVMSGEAVFCTLVLLAGVIAGTGGLQYDTLTLRGIISRLVILVGAMAGGAGVGAATGAVVGVIPGLSFVVAPVIIGAYSFAGLLAGALKQFGKLAVAVGFLLGNIILTIYMASFNEIYGLLVETAVATVSFLLIPARLHETIQGYLPGNQKEPSPSISPQENRLRELTVDRIKNWSSVFTELSRSFDQVSSTVQQSQEEQGLQQLFSEVGKKVCDGCALYRTCWERDYYRTYQSMLDMLSIVELQGKVNIDDLAEDLKKRCARLKEMSITITCLYETYKVNRYWQQRLLESRELVSEQLKGVSRIMEGMSSELEFDVELDGEIDQSLKHKFKKMDIHIQDLYTIHKEDGLMEIGIIKPSCQGQMECRFTIAPIVSKVVGRAFHVASTNCQLKDGDDKCSFKLYPALKYNLDIGIARIGKDGNPISGDSYSIIQLKGGRMALLLSDGMGTGPRAAKESSTVVSLLEHLLESGFNQELAVKTVNSVMMLRPNEETFSTIDLAVLDLYTGDGSFLKIGAVPSYLVRGKRVSLVKTNSLPVGVVDNIQFASVNRILEEGDLLVMVSDGILDAYNGSVDKEEWLSDVLRDVGIMPAQDVADALLALARKVSGGSIHDDMTVISARLESANKE